MFSASCRCLCGARDDPLDPHKVLGSELTLEELDEPLQPRVQGLLAYSAAVNQPLRGVPIREGELWHLSAEETVVQVQFALYVNGFSFTRDGNEVSVSLSPFSLVRNCRLQGSNGSLSELKIFKVSLFTHGLCHYFGVKGAHERQGEEERSRWVLDMSRAMRLVTQSLFPQFRIQCEPLEAVPSTQRRLMAGYLIHHADAEVAAVLYCELHPQSAGQAKLVLYENESCQVLVMEIYVSERSICCEKVGINCSCFCVEDHQFSARTLAEWKLWMRAISNVKVKLQNHAPAPSHDELQHYRQSIKEHINMSAVKGSFEGVPPMDALLQRTSLSSLSPSGLPDPPAAPPVQSVAESTQDPSVSRDARATPGERAGAPCTPLTEQSLADARRPVASAEPPDLTAASIAAIELKLGNDSADEDTAATASVAAPAEDVSDGFVPSADA